MTAVGHIHKYKFSDTVIVLPKTTYYVVDPCYVFTDDQFWDAFCQFSFEGMPEGGVKPEVWMEVNDMPVYTFSTNYGDGVYPVTTMSPKELMGEVGVDSGTLSFIPYKLVKELGQVGRGSGTYVGELEGVPLYNDGDVTFGHIVITTSGTDDVEAGMDEW